MFCLLINTKLLFLTISNFSFYFGHHITSIEGGMACTNDYDLWDMAKLFRSHGMTREASDKLHRIGYYDKWPSGYYKDVVVSRAKTYKRIFGGQYDG